MKQLRAKIFDYDDLKLNTQEIRDYLHAYGFIAVRGVPGFVEKRTHFLEMAQRFVALDDQTKEECTPENAFAFGWSYGIEKFHDKIDSFKGSYYAAIGEKNPHLGNNVWPSESWSQAESFQSAYKDLADTMFKAGKELLPILGLDFEGAKGLGRMLYYGRTPDSDSIQLNSDNNPNWCGEHRDHGLLTALIPSLYLKDGRLASKPEGAGLFIRDAEVIVPDDVVMFQVGEIADLMTNGEITATLHHVKKAYGGLERYSFALFIDVPDDTLIYSDKVAPDYQSRFINGMTYKQWSDASYERYKS